MEILSTPNYRHKTHLPSIIHTILYTKPNIHTIVHTLQYTIPYLHFVLHTLIYTISNLNTIPYLHTIYLNRPRYLRLYIATIRSYIPYLSLQTLFLLYYSSSQTTFSLYFTSLSLSLRHSCILRSRVKVKVPVIVPNNKKPFQIFFLFEIMQKIKR